MPPFTVEEARRESVHRAVKETLGADILKITPVRITLSDVVENDLSQVSIDFIEKRDGKESLIRLSSEGVGPIDALHVAIVGHYGEKFPSLRNIALDDFDMKVVCSREEGPCRSAAVKVRMQFSNSRGTSMTFRSASSSFFTAASAALFSASQFYINCERTFARLIFLRDDAISRSRPDLSQHYTALISELVRVASYEHLVS